MKIEKIKSKLKKVFNRVMGVLLPVATLFVSCGTNALVVHAEESNSVHATGTRIYYENGEETDRYETVMNVSVASGNELIGEVIEWKNSQGIDYKSIRFYVYNKSQNKYYALTRGNCNLTGTYKYYKNGKLQNEYDLSVDIRDEVPFQKGDKDDVIVNGFSISGDIKIFKDGDSLNAFIKSGDTSGMIEVKDPENEKNWYLKNVKYTVTADDSPSSEAGADATYIHFTWDTDNVQDGDLIEIKTYNYYKKIGGEKLSGFHDFITYSDGVGASSGKYSFSQYAATKAWFNSLENKPLMFKDYDTTDYYIRPVRMGALGVEKYGMWIHVKTKRSTPTSSPILDKDSSFDYGDFDENGEWIRDDELTEKNGGIHGMDQNGNWISPDNENPFTGTNLAGMFSYFFDFMKNIPSMLADLPALVSSTIGFLPPVIIGFIGIGVVIAIILRVVGR